MYIHTHPRCICVDEDEKWWWWNPQGLLGWFDLFIWASDRGWVTHVGVRIHNLGQCLLESKPLLRISCFEASVTHPCRYPRDHHTELHDTVFSYKYILIHTLRVEKNLFYVLRARKIIVHKKIVGSRIYWNKPF